MFSGIHLSGAEVYGSFQQGSTFIRSFLRTSDDIVPGGQRQILQLSQFFLAFQTVKG